MRRWWRDYAAECELWLESLDEKARAVFALADGIEVRLRCWCDHTLDAEVRAEPIREICAG